MNELEPPLDWDNTDQADADEPTQGTSTGAADIETRLTELEAVVVELARDVGRVVDGDVAVMLEHLGQRVDVVEELTGRGHWAPDANDDLEQFVQWLSTTFYLGDVLHRWQDNTAIQRELNALHIAWRHVCGPKAGPFDALSWHDHLDRVTARLTDHRARARKTTD